MGEMKQRMLNGELYIADDPELHEDMARAQRLLEQFNATSYSEQALRDDVLRTLLGEVGDGVVIRPTLRCDYGTQITIGERTFINYDCVLLDVAAITIGADCQLAPRVQLLTAGHPIDPVQRRDGWEFGAPVTLGDNVWLGAGVIVCPGVTIGRDSVVGAGAVVTRDVPASSVAYGNPARVRRGVETRGRAAP